MSCTFSKMPELATPPITATPPPSRPTAWVVSPLFTIVEL